MSSAECVLIHVGADLVAPARSKLVELVVSLMRIAIRVSLEIGQADVSDHINAFELRRSNESVPKLCGSRNARCSPYGSRP